MTQHTSLSIGEEASSRKSRPLRKFGSASVQRPISEAIRQANATELYLQSLQEKQPL